MTNLRFEFMAIESSTTIELSKILDLDLKRFKNNYKSRVGLECSSSEATLVVLDKLEKKVQK